ncbi:MAG: hypothetical protein ACQES9_11915 [Myxococcota bacterium]
MTQFLQENIPGIKIQQIDKIQNKINLNKVIFIAEAQGVEKSPEADLYFSEDQKFEGNEKVLAFPSQKQEILSRINNIHNIKEVKIENSPNFQNDYPDNNNSLPNLDSDIFTIAGKDNKDDTAKLKTEKTEALPEDSDYISQESDLNIDDQTLGIQGDEDSLELEEKSEDLITSEGKSSVDSSNNLTNIPSLDETFHNKNSSKIKVEKLINIDYAEENEVNPPKYKTENDETVINNTSLIEKTNPGKKIVQKSEDYEATKDSEDWLKEEFARSLFNAHEKGFTGSLQISGNNETLIVFWENGFIGDIEGYGHILTRLLAYEGVKHHITRDLLRSSGSPLKNAIKRNLIKKKDRNKWALRCIEEGFVSAITEKSKVKFDPSSSMSMNFQLQLIDPKPLILRGIVENYSVATSWARGGGISPVIVNEDLFYELISGYSFDPLWIRVVELFKNGLEWSEAAIRGGITIEEGESLAYGLRLLKVLSPDIPQSIPHEEIERQKIIENLNKIKNSAFHKLFHDNSAKNRRKLKDLKVMLNNLPDKLKLYLDQEIQEIKNELSQD